MELHHHHPHDETPGDHREQEKIVELTRVPTRFEADTIVAALEARGIRASAMHGDAAGFATNLATAIGHQVVVFEGDVETARALLVEQQGDDPAEQ